MELELHEVAKSIRVAYLFYEMICNPFYFKDKGVAL